MARGRPKTLCEEEALERALRLFWERGYEGVSIGDLTAALGVGPSSVYNTFGSKAELFKRAMARYEATRGCGMAGALEGGGTAVEAVRAAMVRAAESQTRRGDPSGCALVLAATNCSEGSQGIEKWLREKRRATEAAVRARIERGKEEGDVARDVDAGRVARYVSAVVQGMAQQARDGATRKQLREVAEDAGAAVEGMMRG